jgi:hypothetical protein
MKCMLQDLEVKMFTTSKISEVRNPYTDEPLVMLFFFFNVFKRLCILNKI